MADTRLYRMTLEEVKEFISQVEPEWKDFEKAKKYLYITVFDDKYLDEYRTNSIKFDNQNKFMYHAGRLIGTVQLAKPADDGYYDRYQLSNSFADYWGMSYADIWIAAVHNGVIDMRFMAEEDTSGEVVEIAGSFVREAVRGMRKKGR